MYCEKWEVGFNATIISSYYTYTPTPVYGIMFNWLIKERQHLNYDIKSLQFGEATAFMSADLILPNFTQYYRLFYKTDIMISEMTILYKKEFTGTFNFYPSSNHCHSSLSFTCSYPPFSSSFWKIPSHCFTDSHALILWAHVRSQKMQLLEKQVCFFFFLESRRNTSTNKKFSENTVDIFSIQFSYLSSSVDWEKSNKWGESKLTKLSLLIKTASILSIHELLGPGPLIPLGLSTTSKHFTPLHLFAKTSSNNRQSSSKARDLKWWSSAQPGHWDMQIGISLFGPHKELYQGFTHPWWVARKTTI